MGRGEAPRQTYQLARPKAARGWPFHSVLIPIQGSKIRLQPKALSGERPAGEVCRRLVAAGRLPVTFHSPRHMKLSACTHALRISRPRVLWKLPKAALNRDRLVPSATGGDLPNAMTNNLAICLVTLLLVGLPILAHASEVGHIMNSFFSLIKLTVGLLAGLILLLFLLVKAVVRK
jgi:hypothetical protein